MQKAYYAQGRSQRVGDLNLEFEEIINPKEWMYERV